MLRSSTTRLFAPVVGLSLLLACDDGATPKPAAEAKTDLKIEAKTDIKTDAKTDAKMPETKVSAPPDAEGPPKAEVAEPEAESSPAGLRIVATREGDLDLQVTPSGAPLVALDNEPLAWAGGVLRRQPSGYAGLPHGVGAGPLVGFIGDPASDRVAWMTTVYYEDRIVPDYRVHERVAGSWRTLEMSRGPITGYYSAYVERKGAWLGLRSWAADSSKDPGDDHSPAGVKYRKAVDKALGKIRSEWIHLDGPKVPLPIIPEGVHPYTAATTTDGTLLALAPKTVGGTDRAELLVWVPGSREAERIALPGTEELREPALAVGGEWGVIHGRTGHFGDWKGYLVVGRADTWTPVPLDMPTTPPGAQHTLLGAARSADGELWVARHMVGTSAVPQPSLWRKPAGGEWEAVPLPAFGADLFETGKGWSKVHSRGGIGFEPIERPAVPSVATRVDQLYWADGGFWVGVELGPAFTDEEHLYNPVSRSVLLTTAAGSEPVTSLPSELDIDLERRNDKLRAVEPGRSGCHEYAVRLGPPPKDPKAAVAKILAIGDIEEHEAGVQIAYIGQIDGSEELVISAYGSEPKLADRLLAKIDEATELPFNPGCVIPPFVRLVDKAATL